MDHARLPAVLLAMRCGQVNGTVTVAALDTELAELHLRAQRCRDLIHRCMIELVGIESRADVVLDRRNDVYRIEQAAQATLNPGKR